MRRAPALTLVLLVLASLSLRLLWLGYPRTQLIFDERYYVNAARVILGLPVSFPRARLAGVTMPQDLYEYEVAAKGLDPNKEHPPLGKLIISLSMHWLGANSLAWRLPSAILGTFAVLCVYGIARALTTDRWLCLLASFIFAFDNLVFVHSRMGTLDMMMLAFMLAGLWAYLTGRVALAGLGLSLSSLVKVTGVYGYGTLALYEAATLTIAWWHSRRALMKLSAPGDDTAIGQQSRSSDAPWIQEATTGSPRPRRSVTFKSPLARLGVLTVVYLAAFLGLLWVLDLGWSSFEDPFTHLSYIAAKAAANSRPSGPLFDESYPWQWLNNDEQMVYFRGEVAVEAGAVKANRTLIFFRGGMNPFVVAMTPLALVSAVYLAVRGADSLALFALSLFAMTHLPNYLALLVTYRIEYIYYFLPSMPAVALATAQLFRQQGLPSYLTWAYVGAVLLGYYEYFPYKQISIPWLFWRRL